MRGGGVNAFGDNQINTSISSIALSLIVCLSFMAHLFFYSLSATAYLILLFVLTACYILSKPIILADKKIFRLLIVCELSILSSFFRSQRLAGSLIDVAVLSLGILLVIFYSRRINNYSRMMTVILFFALFFAIGTIINSLMPGLYRSLLSLFPSSYATVVREQAVNRVPGFSTNPGFSAGYISSGIIVIFAGYQKNKIITLSRFIVLTLLVFALLFTGKRGPSISLIFTLLTCYLIPIRGLKKIKRYWNFFLVILFSFILFVIFQDFLITIPAISKISRTISGLLVGDDVSSGRNKLYFRYF